MILMAVVQVWAHGRAYPHHQIDAQDLGRIWRTPISCNASTDDAGMNSAAALHLKRDMAGAFVGSSTSAFLENNTLTRS